MSSVSYKCVFLNEKNNIFIQHFTDDIMFELFFLFFKFSYRWVSVLQNSKEEALNNAFKGEQDEDENNIVQELSKAIVSEVKRMSGNDVCCDCGAPSKCFISPCCATTFLTFR